MISIKLQILLPNFHLQQNVALLWRIPTR